MNRKFDYKLDTKNGKELQGHTMDDILQQGWYAIQSRAEQNEKNKKIMKLVKTDARFKGVLETARAQVKKEA